jgi:hypoxanthine phosphoribosyltransferase
VQAFTPDFYLPAYDLYIEITTLNQKLVTKKNRKARRLKELHPEVNIRVFYQRDYLSLLMKYGLEPPSQLVSEAGVPPFWLAAPDTPPPADPDLAPAQPDDAGQQPRRRRSKSA